MYPRVVQATLRGLLAWPDLLVFGLLSFALSLGLNAVFQPFWTGNVALAASAESGTSLILGLAGLLAQQFILTAGSIVIAVAAARVILVRLRGGTMPVLDALRLRSYIRPILTYSLLYAVVTALVSFAYLMFLLGEGAASFGGNLTTTGATGLTQVPTTLNPGAAGILLLVFFPLLGVWTFANILVPPVIAAEQTGAWPAIVRSGSLVRRTFTIVVGLIMTVFAFSCGLAFVLSMMMVSSMDMIELQQMSEMPSMMLPELPFVMQAGLSALLFIIGSIFTSAWYLVAVEDETLAR